MTDRLALNQSQAEALGIMPVGDTLLHADETANPGVLNLTVQETAPMAADNFGPSIPALNEKIFYMTEALAKSGYGAPTPASPTKAPRAGTGGHNKKGQRKTATPTLAKGNAPTISAKQLKKINKMIPRSKEAHLAMKRDLNNLKLLRVKRQQAAVPTAPVRTITVTGEQSYKAQIATGAMPANATIEDRPRIWNERNYGHRSHTPLSRNVARMTNAYAPLLDAEHKLDLNRKLNNMRHLDISPEQKKRLVINLALKEKAEQDKEKRLKAQKKAELTEFQKPNKPSNALFRGKHPLLAMAFTG